MDQTFLFYDLETTGKDPSRDRIMQFAAQRTSMNLKPIGDPIDIKVRLTDDVLPSPGAALVTGLTPQQTADGMSELELSRFVQREVFTPGTIVVGFNNVSFDDNFMRFLFWRNFYDPYEWAWKDGRSRWDLLDVTRMVRAIRPEGIKWPNNTDGSPCNKLEAIAEANGLTHHQAHDGLSDVIALIELAQLIKRAQPKMFTYLLAMRDKNRVADLVNLSQPDPFVYTTTRYGNNHHYTSVACAIAEGNTNNAVLTYNLRYDPTPWLRFSAKELAELRFTSYEDLDKRGLPAFPFTTLTTNQCPAVAPLSVLEAEDGWQRLALNPDTVKHNMQILQKNPGLIDEVKAAYQSEPYPAIDKDAEQRLYDGFLNDADRQTVTNVRQADEAKLAMWSPYFHDERLPELYLHYKARNYPESLSQVELEEWKKYVSHKLTLEEPLFAAEMSDLKSTAKPDEVKILADLQAWRDRIMSGLSITKQA